MSCDTCLDAVCDGIRGAVCDVLTHESDDGHLQINDTILEDYVSAREYVKVRNAGSSPY